MRPRKYNNSKSPENATYTTGLVTNGKDRYFLPGYGEKRAPQKRKDQEEQNYLFKSEGEFHPDVSP